MADTWCVYLSEYVTVYSSEARGVDGREECVAEFDRRYREKVPDEGWRLKNAGVRPYRYQLQVQLPTLKGEYKDEGEARDRASRLGRGAVAVLWGSAEEQQLLDYGDRLLSTA